MSLHFATLKLEIISATDLARKDITTNSSDPFCDIIIKNEQNERLLKLKTSTIEKDINPIWNQNFEIPIPVKSRLILKVWDEDLTSNDFLGYYSIPLEDILNEGTKEMNIDLQSRPKRHDRVCGKLHFKATFYNGAKPVSKINLLEHKTEHNTEHSTEQKTDNTEQKTEQKTEQITDNTEQKTDNTEQKTEQKNR